MNETDMINEVCVNQFETDGVKYHTSCWLNRNAGAGGVSGAGAGGGSGCFICGGPHLKRDCPNYGPGSAGREGADGKSMTGTNEIESRRPEREWGAQGGPSSSSGGGSRHRDGGGGGGAPDRYR